MPNYHPLFVHFPIAFLTLACFFDFAGVVLKKPEFNRMGWWGLIAGVAGLAVTLVTGLLAEDTVTIPAAARDTFEFHEELAFVVAALFVVLLLWRIANRSVLPVKFRSVYLALIAIGMVMILTGAWLGGEMVYRYGVGVR